jgi:hypothetical protein
MSQKCQFRTYALQQTASSFNYFVGAQKQRGRNVEADSRSSFEVEHKLEDGWLLNGKIGWRGATQDVDEQPSHLPVHQSEPRTETDEAAIFHDLR